MEVTPRLHTLLPSLLDASDPEMDEELRLPEDLSGISRRERIELYKFKQQHTEARFPLLLDH